MAKKIEDEFNFDDYFEDDITDEDDDVEPLINEVYNDEEEFNKLIDLHNDIKEVGYDAQYPYILVRGFLNDNELLFMADRVNRYKNKLIINDEHELISVLFEDSNGTLREIDKVPLILDTILTIISVHKYSIYLVQSEDNAMKIGSSSMKALIFT